jgi:hypothetical protein
VVPLTTQPILARTEPSSRFGQTCRRFARHAIRSLHICWKSRRAKNLGVAGKGRSKHRPVWRDLDGRRTCRTRTQVKANIFGIKIRQTVPANEPPLHPEQQHGDSLEPGKRSGPRRRVPGGNQTRNLTLAYPLRFSSAEARPPGRQTIPEFRSMRSDGRHGYTWGQDIPVAPRYRCSSIG